MSLSATHALPLTLPSGPSWSAGLCSQECGEKRDGHAQSSLIQKAISAMNSGTKPFTCHLASSFPRRTRAFSALSGRSQRREWRTRRPGRELACVVAWQINGREAKMFHLPDICAAHFL